MICDLMAFCSVSVTLWRWKGECVYYNRLEQILPIARLEPGTAKQEVQHLKTDIIQLLAA